MITIIILSYISHALITFYLFQYMWRKQSDFTKNDLFVFTLLSLVPGTMLAAFFMAVDGFFCKSKNGIIWRKYD